MNVLFVDTVKPTTNRTLLLNMKGKMLLGKLYNGQSITCQQIMSKNNDTKIYYTPDSVLDYIRREQIIVIIGNPPYEAN